MRLSRTFYQSLRNDPHEADTRAQKWLLRANFIRKVAAGIFTYLPFGFRVLKRIEMIVREEMNRIGGQEVMMPILLPRSLWEETGRWDIYGKELMRLQDRHGRDYCLAPTHEEMITAIVQAQISSYRQLPLLLYQIQTKFRDEIRPRFGLMRAREFVMKDAYSFEPDLSSLEKTYQEMFQAYETIFHRCGLTARAVEATSGAIGGDVSHEFMVPAEAGEDVLLHCPHCGYAANRERAEALPRAFAEEDLPLKEVSTPNVSTVEDVAGFLKVSPEKLIKTLIIKTEKGAVGILLRGDRELNEEKVKKAVGVTELSMAAPKEIEQLTGGPVGFSGPVNLSLPLWADEEVRNIRGGVTGANRSDTHLVGVTEGRDFSVSEVADLRVAEHGDRCSRCQIGLLEQRRGIEVGHIFKLGTKYSKAMGLTVKGSDSEPQDVIMGCYGIGVSRILFSLAETCSDEQGLRFSASVAPFLFHLVCVNQEDSKMSSTAEKIYSQAMKEGDDLLYDDRHERAGVKFKDADLIGSAFQIVAGRDSAEGKVELKNRWTGERQKMSIEHIFSFMKDVACKAVDGR